MSKIIKKILNFQKRKNGNISILVLIMSMAIILLTTAMVGYIFHDIRFTELDKGELRALHFAESGLANMYYKIEQGLIPDLPSEDTYNRDVPDSTDPEGSFKVEYEIKDVGGFEYYIITSTGTDIRSGAKRTVWVETYYINISGLVSGRASGAGKLSGQINITGPFFIADGIDDDLLGNTSFKKGPLIVKGDITVSGNASIGEPKGVGYGPIILIQDGYFYKKGDPNPVEDPKNNPPDNVYLLDYINKTFDITLTNIDDDYIELAVNSGALVIDGNLFIGDGIIEVDGEAIVGAEDFLEFNNGILEISSREPGLFIVVYGDIEIGGKGDTIYYSGNVNIISTGNIAIRAKVRPEDMNDFPSPDLMTLISQNNIDLYAKGGNYEEPDVAAMLIANYKVETQSTNTFLRGGTVSNDLTLKQGTTIYYETGIGEAVTAAIPGFNESMLMPKEWQEIIPD